MLRRALHSVVDTHSMRLEPFTQRQPSWEPISTFLVFVLQFSVRLLLKVPTPLLSATVMASRLLAISQLTRGNSMGVSVNDILQMMQQQGTPPAPTPDDPTMRRQRMLSMLGVLSGDPSLSNFGKTSLSEMDKQAEMKQRLDQENYQRQQDSVQKNIELARLTQGDAEQQQ